MVTARDGHHLPAEGTFMFDHTLDRLLEHNDAVDAGVHGMREGGGERVELLVEFRRPPLLVPPEPRVTLGETRLEEGEEGVRQDRIEGVRQRLACPRDRGAPSPDRSPSNRALGRS